MRLRCELVCFASADSVIGTPACGLPSASSATAVSVIFFFTDTHSLAFRPTTTAAGHSGETVDTVWISPLGSAKVISVSNSCGVFCGGRFLTTVLPAPFLSSVTASLSATIFCLSSPLSSFRLNEKPS